MSFLTRMHLSRRAVLKGAGATIALPLLDAMIPARTALAQTVSGQQRATGFYERDVAQLRQPAEARSEDRRRHHRRSDRREVSR